jgi:hypothetical protein
VNEDAIRLLESRGWRLRAMDPIGGKAEELRMHRYAAPRQHDGVA